MNTVFTLSLANVPIKATVLFASTRDFCADYLTDEEPRVFVTVTREDIAAEREKSEKEDLLEGLPVRQFPDEYLETLALYRKIVKELLCENVLLFHGAVIALDNEGVLFTAPSGTGKTTHIMLWQKAFGERVEIINGDKPLLRFAENGVFACGTPWQGKENRGCNKQVPLKGICLLGRDTVNHVEKIPFAAALPTLLQQSYRFCEAEPVRRMMSLIGRLSSVGLYRLGCNMELEAALVAERGIFSEKTVSN